MKMELWSLSKTTLITTRFKCRWCFAMSNMVTCGLKRRWQYNIHHKRILFDSDFIDDTLSKVDLFVKLAILPQLIRKWFTKLPVLPLESSFSDHNDCTSSNSKLVWCYCRKDEEFDNMIACDNEQCAIQWHHLSCLKIPQSQVPKGKWYCLDCHKQKSRATKKWWLLSTSHMLLCNCGSHL